MNFVEGFLNELDLSLAKLEAEVICLMEDSAEGVEDEDLYAALVRMEEMRERYKQCQEAIATMVAYRMKDDIAIAKGGTLERKMGSTRKSWNHKVLKSVVAEKVLERAIDPETGEIMAPTSQLIHEALDMAGIQYWKVKSLKPLGVNVSSYCEEKTGDPKIIIRLANKKPDADDDEDED